MRAFLSLFLVFIALFSFSSDKENEQVFPIYAQQELDDFPVGSVRDMSFEVSREIQSLEKIMADRRQTLITHFLYTLMNDEGGKVKFMQSSSDLPKEKLDLLQLLILERVFQRQMLKLSPELIENWITTEIQVEDLAYFKPYYPNLEQADHLGTKETLGAMPHLFLSIADRDIMEEVFETKGFDPYFRTSMGDNLFHSFMLFTRIKNVIGDGLTEDSYKNAFRFLIERSPSELLSQKNDRNLTPLSLSVVLSDPIGYKLLMESMNGEDIIKEIPTLEREIINRGYYKLLDPIKETRLKFNELNQIITIGKRGEVFVGLEKEKNSLGQASFMPSEERPFVSRFQFRALASQDRSNGVKTVFPQSQQYENKRIIEIEEIFRDPSNLKIKQIIESIFDRDIQSLREKFNSLDLNLINDERISQIILEESIRTQFEEGVLFSIDFLKNTEVVFYDSVFLSLFNYASLPKSHPGKETAKKIVRILTSAKIEMRGEILIDPFFWSIYLALPDELDYFIKIIEEYGGMRVDPEQIADAIQYAYQEGYVGIFNYLNDKLKEYPEVEFKCQKIFLH